MQNQARDITPEGLRFVTFVIGNVASELNTSGDRSNTYQLMREGVSDMHARSDGYLADELMIEYGFTE